MKIQLKYIDNKLAGYDLIPENEEEMKALGSIRELYFWGSGEDALQIENFEMDKKAIKYDGIATDQTEKYVTKMMFLRQKHERDFYDDQQEVYSQMVIMPIEAKHSVNYCCSNTECLSLDVQRRAWVNPNENNRFVSYDADQDYKSTCYCNSCKNNVKLEQLPDQITNSST